MVKHFSCWFWNRDVNGTGRGGVGEDSAIPVSVYKFILHPRPIPHFKLGKARMGNPRKDNEFSILDG